MPSPSEDRKWAFPGQVAIQDSVPPPCRPSSVRAPSWSAATLAPRRAEKAPRKATSTVSSATQITPAATVKAVAPDPLSTSTRRAPTLRAPSASATTTPPGGPCADR